MLLRRGAVEHDRSDQCALLGLRSVSLPSLERPRCAPLFSLTPSSPQSTALRVLLLPRRSPEANLGGRVVPRVLHAAQQSTDRSELHPHGAHRGFLLVPHGSRPPLLRFAFPLSLHSCTPRPEIPSRPAVSATARADSPRNAAGRVVRTTCRAAVNATTDLHLPSPKPKAPPREKGKLQSGKLQSGKLQSGKLEKPKGRGTRRTTFSCSATRRGRIPAVNRV